jgi:RNA polymerase sigma factor (sigma-70 family)
MDPLCGTDDEESLLGDEPAAAEEWAGPSKEQAPASLASLIARMAEGRQDALGELYDATVPLIYGLALRITRSPQTAEEVVGATYWQAWLQARRFDINRGSPRSWLLSIARSRSLDATRQIEAARRHSQPESGIEDEPAWQADPQDLLLAVERTNLLHAALEKLDPLPRQLIALAFFKGLTHAEIAAHAELPLGTVKSHIRRAMETLRERMQFQRQLGPLT